MHGPGQSQLWYLYSRDQAQIMGSLNNALTRSDPSILYMASFTVGTGRTSIVWLVNPYVQLLLAIIMQNIHSRLLNIDTAPRSHDSPGIARHLLGVLDMARVTT